MLDVALIALAIAALSPYVLGPIIVRFTQRWPARPVFEPYDPIRHPLPDDLAASFRESLDALARTGLRAIADCAHASEVSKVQLRAALLVDEMGREHALVIAGRSTNPQVKVAAYHVEFPTKFADGGALSVSNSTEADTYPQAAGRALERFPQVRDPGRLRRVNAALLDRHYARRQRVPLDPAQDPTAFIAKASAREYALQVGTGYMWLDERAQVYRPTWRGAWGMSFRLWPPFRQILEGRRRRRAAALLAELGLAGRDERPIPAPAGADPLRWNLIVLLAAALLYVFVRGPGGAGRFALPESFAVPAEFAGAVQALERLTGDSAIPLVGTTAEGDPLPTPGVSVQARAAEALVAAARDRFLARGFYLFVAERHFGLGEPDRVGLFPRSNPYEIMALMGTNGWNYDIAPDSIIAWLRTLERAHPFVITGIGFDWVEGRFLAGIPDADALARRFYAFCPDIVDQGAGSVEELAQELRRSSVLYCWWD